MTKVVLDDAKMIETLDTIRDRSQICDSTGRVIGVFVPRSLADRVFYKGIKSPYSKEELERRYREEAATARPLSEFWEEMRKKHPEKFQ